MKKQPLIALLAALCCAPLCRAVSVTPGQAALAARNWLGAEATVSTDEASPVTDEEGQVVAYGVPTVRGGVVLITTDTAFAPVVGYLPACDMADLPAGHPLRLVLRRMGAAQRQTLARRARAADPETLANEAAWASLLASRAQPRASTVTSNAVSAFGTILHPTLDAAAWIAWNDALSHWNQQGGNNWYPVSAQEPEKNLYSRDLPVVKTTMKLPDSVPEPPYVQESLAVAGCVAVAGAIVQQACRYPSWTEGGKSYTCTVVDTVIESTTVSKEERQISMASRTGSDDWGALESLNWTNEELVAAIRDLTNRTTLNTGLLVGTTYGSDGSVANTVPLADALTTLGFRDARYVENEAGGDPVPFLKRFVYPMLMAGRPVVLSLRGEATMTSEFVPATKAGTQIDHAIVATGLSWSASDSAFYAALHWGWGGLGDGWFDLSQTLSVKTATSETIPGGGTVTAEKTYAYSTLKGVVTLIVPPAVGQETRYVPIVGQVLSAAGVGVEGATVSFGKVRTKSGAGGWFALEVASDKQADELQAMRDGEIVAVPLSLPGLGTAVGLEQAIPDWQTLRLPGPTDWVAELSPLVDPSGKERLTDKAANKLAQLVVQSEAEFGIDVSRVTVETQSDQLKLLSPIKAINATFGEIVDDANVTIPQSFNTGTGELILRLNWSIAVSGLGVPEVPLGVAARAAAGVGSLSLTLTGGEGALAFAADVPARVLASETPDFASSRELPVTSREVEGNRLTLRFEPPAAGTCFLKAVLGEE